MAASAMSNGRGDESDDLMRQMAFPCVVGPVLQQLEDRSTTHAPTLIREGIEQVEREAPGFTKFFIEKLLEKAEIRDKINLSETILKLEGTGEQQDVRLRHRSKEPAFHTLQLKANKLKIILGKIPHEIDDRRRFLETIKDIAQAIKHLLDAVSGVYHELTTQEDQTALDRKKREFVKYSKRFSQTLKEFFKENSPNDETATSVQWKDVVYLSANHLIHQTNQILLAVA